MIHYVNNGETSSGIVQDSDALVVLSGGVVKNTEIKNSGHVDVSSGGKADSTIINDGDTGGLFIFDGGVANDVTVNSGGYVKVTGGGKAKNVVENGGYVFIPDEQENGHPNVTFKKNSFSGVVLNNVERKASVHSGTTAVDTTVDSDGIFRVFGGIANGTTVNSGGEMDVYSGTADNTVVNSGGEMYVFSGSANSTVVNSGGYLKITSDGTATDIVENGGYVYISGEDDYGIIPNVTFQQNTFTGLKLDGTSATVHSGTTADGTMIGADGLLCVFSGGFANDVTVDPTGKLWIYSGGLANGITVGAGGELNVGYGGWITGRMTFEAGAIVAPATEAILDFDLRQTAPGETPLVNDLSFISETFLFTITVNGAQPDGTYKLAGGAAAFDQTVYVINTAGRTLGTLTVGGSLSTGMADYTLKKNGSNLTVDVVAKVTENCPPEPYNDELVNKDKSVNTKVTEAYGTHLSAPGNDIYLDKIGTVDETVRGVTYCNHVKKQVNKVGDKIDYAKIVIDHGVKLSFHAEASAAATFTVYSLTKNKKGQYKAPKKLLTLKLTDKDKDGKFTADSKKLLQLQVSGEYYVSMQYTDRRKTATDAYYNVWLNDNSEFYDLGDNTDDWGDMKTAGWDGAVADLGTVTDSGKLITDEWIGFGDKFDYKKFTLADAAQLDFSFNTPGGFVKFTVCKLKETEKRDGSKTYSQITVKTVTATAKKPVVTINDLRLEAGDYYIKVQSTNIQKCTGYDVKVTKSTFYTDGDGGWNDALLNKKALDKNAQYFYDNKLALESGSIHFDKAGDYKTSKTAATYTFEGKPYGGFVGFGDETDFAKLTVTKTVDVTFSLLATNDATLEVIQVTKKDEDKYTKKSLQTIKYKQGNEDPAVSKNAVTLEVKDGISYYVSVKATNTRNVKVDPNTYYNVTYTIDTHEAASLSMPETDILAMIDAMSFGNYAADSFSDASASILADLTDQSSLQPLALLG